MTRYAIYHAPDPVSAFWQRAAEWLGRDAASGAVLAQPAIPGLSAERFHALTADPRHYGFHATLKAPFRLAPGQDEAALRDALAAFARTQVAFEAGLSPAALGRFLAFRPSTPSPAIDALHAAALAAFEPFRAPLSDGDLVRRRRAGLSPEQDQLLVTWGYPYVLDHFRFHLTLTGSLSDEGERDALLTAAQDWFRADIGTHRFAAISLFRQDEGEDFMLIEHVPFGG